MKIASASKPDAEHFKLGVECIERKLQQLKLDAETPIPILIKASEPPPIRVVQKDAPRIFKMV